MNKIPNRQAICEVLMKHAETDKDIVVLCSDSRGSASLTPFANAYPEQFVEMGIAEQDLVSVSAGLAKCGKKAFAASPACFLSTRSYEQAKIDCAYSNTNVKLIGISGGVSYGALGMSIILHRTSQQWQLFRTCAFICQATASRQQNWLRRFLLMKTGLYPGGKKCRCGYLQRRKYSV